MLSPQNLYQLGRIRHPHWQAGYRVANLDLCILLPDQGYSGLPAIVYPNPFIFQNQFLTICLVGIKEN